MKKPGLSILLGIFIQTILTAQPAGVKINGKEFFRNDDVVFYQIDDHTWIGSGHMMANESLYLVEGNDRSVLIIRCRSKRT